MTKNINKKIVFYINQQVEIKYLIIIRKIVVKVFNNKIKITHLVSYKYFHFLRKFEKDLKSLEIFHKSVFITDQLVQKSKTSNFIIQ